MGEGCVHRHLSAVALGLQKGGSELAGPCPSPGRSESGSLNMDLFRASCLSICALSHFILTTT